MEEHVSIEKGRKVGGKDGLSGLVRDLILLYFLV